MRDQAARHLAADVLSQATQGTGSDLLIALLSVCDSGLLAAEPALRQACDHLADRAIQAGETLAQLTQSTDSMRRDLERRFVRNLAEEMDLYAILNAPVSGELETALAELAAIFEEAAALVAKIDDLGEESRGRKRPTPPIFRRLWRAAA